MDPDSAERFEFTKLWKYSKKLEIWTFPDGIQHEMNSNGIDITDSEVKEWLNEAPKSKGGQSHVAGLRLIIQEKEKPKEIMKEQTMEETKIEPYKIPFQKDTFEYMLRKWGFSTVEMPWISAYMGACRLFVVESNDSAKIDFVLGGGLYHYSIEGVFSYDCSSNITTGYIVSGWPIERWVHTIASKFREIPHPMTVAVAMAEALRQTSMSLRERFSLGIAKMEETTEQDPNALLGDRSLAVDLCRINRNHGLTKMTIERSRLHLTFIAENLEPKENNPFWRKPWCPSLEQPNKDLLGRIKSNLSAISYLHSEGSNALSRIQTQGIVISNLIAKGDMDTSIKVARDSRELAAASRKDSAAMRTIALVTTIFLPGTFTAAFLSMPLFNWDQSAPASIITTHLWFYFAITIPLTATTVGVMLAWLRRQDRKHKKLAEEARLNEELGSDSGRSESEDSVV